MKNATMIQRLLKTYRALIEDFEDIQSILYAQNYMEEYFVIEFHSRNENRKTFVLKFGCGHLESINTQYNTMQMFLGAINNYEYSEFIHNPHHDFFIEA